MSAGACCRANRGSDFLSRLVRETDQQEAALARLEEIFRVERIQVGRRTWKRQDLHLVGKVAVRMSADAPSASFVDTNVLVYALATDDRKRSPEAQELLRELMATQTLHTSTQVIEESFVTVTRKVRTPLTAEQALRYMDQIAAWPVAVLDHGTVRAGGRVVWRCLRRTSTKPAPREASAIVAHNSGSVLLTCPVWPNMPGVLISRRGTIDHTSDNRGFRSFLSIRSGCGCMRRGSAFSGHGEMWPMGPALK